MNGKVISSHSTDLMMGNVCFFPWGNQRLEFLASLHVWDFLNKTHQPLYQNTLSIYQLYLTCIDSLIVQLIQFEIVNGISFAYYWGNVCVWKRKMAWGNFVFVIGYQSLKKTLKVLNFNIIFLMVSYYCIIFL